MGETVAGSIKLGFTQYSPATHVYSSPIVVEDLLVAVVAVVDFVVDVVDFVVDAVVVVVSSALVGTDTLIEPSVLFTVNSTSASLAA